LLPGPACFCDERLRRREGEMRRRTPKVNTEVLFGYERGIGPVQVLGLKDVWGLEEEELRGVLEVLEKVWLAALSDPGAFKEEHVRVLEGAMEVIQDLLMPEPPSEA